MLDHLYAFPDSAIVEQNISKTKLYSQGLNNKESKNISDFSSIIWKYRLSSDTTPYARSDIIPEIQIVEIKLEKDQVNTDVLRAVDILIPYPVIFEIFNNLNQVKLIAAYKEFNSDQNNSGESNYNLSAYFGSNWLDCDQCERKPLPNVSNIYELYEHIILKLFPYRIHEGETVSEVFKRLEKINIIHNKIFELNEKIKKETVPAFKKNLQIIQGNLKKDLSKLVV